MGHFPLAAMSLQPVLNTVWEVYTNQLFVKFKFWCHTNSCYTISRNTSWADLQKPGWSYFQALKSQTFFPTYNKFNVLEKKNKCNDGTMIYRTRAIFQLTFGKLEKKKGGRKILNILSSLNISQLYDFFPLTILLLCSTFCVSE